MRRVMCKSKIFVDETNAIRDAGPAAPGGPRLRVDRG